MMKAWRKLTALGLVLSTLMISAVCAAPAQAPPERFAVSFAGGVLFIKTNRYDVRWQNGSMIGARSLLSKGAALTVAGTPMNVEQMPNGLGSFHEQEAAGRAQHHPWGSISAPFPAQHPPTDQTPVRFEKMPRGARLTYSGLKGDAQATLIQELTVEERTSDLVISQRGKSSHAGVFGVGFSLLNLRPDIEWAVPYFGGQKWRGDAHKGSVMSIAWPQFWSAGLIVGQMPQAGAFAVWAEDAQMRPKYLRHFNGDGVQALEFETCNDWPYHDKKEIKSFNWRFNTFGGSTQNAWMEAAGRYKSWMVKAQRMVPRAQRPTRWVNDIALIWPAQIDEGAMKKMSEIIDPRQILMMDWDWLQGFNRRIPEYKPKDEQAAAKIALAHRYGYRTGIYTSLALLDQETHPAMMKKYGLEYLFNGLQGDKPTEATAKDWLQYVHPGSAKWREFYSDRMRDVQRQYGIDYLYQDVTGCAVGSSGLIDGKTYSAGVVAVESAIRTKVPQAGVGGEFWNEVNAAREDFGLTTFLGWGDETHREWISRADQPHPILSYLLSDYCVYWPHQIPIRDTKRFHRDQNINEVIGAIPTWEAAPEERASEARVVIERARMWAAGFRPAFPRRWKAGAVSYLRDPRGRLVKYVRRGGSSYCYEETPRGDRLRYARITGQNRANLGSPVTIDGWVAYDKQGPIGLNPDSWYCLFPGAPPASALTITQLPPGASIKGTRRTNGYVLVEVAGKGSGTIAWRSSQKLATVSDGATRRAGSANKMTINLPTSVLFAFKPAQAVIPSVALPFLKWRHRMISNGQVVSEALPPQEQTRELNGQIRHGYMVGPALGGLGSENSADGFIRLPNDSKIALKTSLGRLGGEGDGVNFVVRVNGQEIWRHFSESKTGWEDVTVPLGAFAGQDVVLSLALDCGPSGHNTSNDQALWGDPTIVAQ